jgi:hypothetical protein
MRAMVVEVGPKIEQLVFEICRRPEHRVIQIVELIRWIVVGAEVLRHPEVASNGAVEHPAECDRFIPALSE